MLADVGFNLKAKSDNNINNIMGFNPYRLFKFHFNMIRSVQDELGLIATPCAFGLSNIFVCILETRRKNYQPNNINIITTIC